MSSSSFSFFQDLKFLPYKSFTCLVRVTPRYFILVMAIVEDVVCLFLSQPVCCLYIVGLLIFFQLIVYLATLMKAFINCRNFLVEFLRSLMYIIISPDNNDTLTPSFPICVP